LEILKSPLRKEVDVGGVLVGLNRGVIRDVDNDTCARSADPVDLLEKRDQVLDMLKQMTAKDFVDSIVEKRQFPLEFAHDIHALGADLVDAEIAVPFDAAGSQVKPDMFSPGWRVFPTIRHGFMIMESRPEARATFPDFCQSI